jgi:putative restriction endonuclease
MPAVLSAELVLAILDAIEQSGEAGILTTNARVHPRKIAVSGPQEDVELWIYAWTLTFGGRPALPDEYRIQMTSVSSPLALNPAGLTLLLGYEPSLKVFAGFDLQRHRTFTTGSPSVQIDMTALRQALQDGLAFHRKDNNEIAIAIRPDQFMAYARNAADLHRFGRRRPMLEMLTRASTLQPINPLKVERLSAERQRIVQVVSRLSRSANFREQVLNGYGHRCAVTRLQLRLVDAAHILPVPAPGSSDHIINGVALSPTYHRAFDCGLIYLDEDRVMRTNPNKEQELAHLELGGGLAEFRSSLGKIHLPADRHQWPDARFIRKANRFRRIAT